MVEFKSSNTISVGEAMVELAPVGEGQYKRGFAGDTFNTAWHMAQALHGRASVGFATRVGMDKIPMPLLPNSRPTTWTSP